MEVKAAIIEILTDLHTFLHAMGMEEQVQLFFTEEMQDQILQAYLLDDFSLVFTDEFFENLEATGSMNLFFASMGGAEAMGMTPAPLEFAQYPISCGKL